MKKEHCNNCEQPEHIGRGCHSLPKTGEKCEWNPFCPDKLLCDKHKSTPQSEKKCCDECFHPVSDDKSIGYCNDQPNEKPCPCHSTPTPEKEKCTCDSPSAECKLHDECKKGCCPTPPPLASDEWTAEKAAEIIKTLEKIPGKTLYLYDTISSLLLRQQDEIVRKVNEMKKKHGTIHNPHEAWNNGYNQALNDFITNIKNK